MARPAQPHVNGLGSKAKDDEVPRAAIHLPSIDPGNDSPSKFPLLHKLTASESVLAIEVDDDCLYAGLNTGDIAVWSLDTARLIHIVRGHEEAVLSLCLSDDKSRLFSAGSDSMLNVWSVQDLELLYSIRSEPRVGDIFALAFSADRNTIYCGAQDHSIQWHQFGDESELLQPPVESRVDAKNKFFDSATKPKDAELDGSSKEPSKAHRTKVKAKYQQWFQPANINRFAHSGAIQCMLLLRVHEGNHLPQEQCLVSGGSDGYIKLWTLGDSNESIVCKAKLRNSRLPVCSMSLSGDLLYCGLGEGYINVFNIESKQLVYSLFVGKGDILATRVINGSTLCGTSNGLVRQIDPGLSGVNTWKSHSGKILASTTGRLGSRGALVTGGNDNCIYFWDVSSIVQQPRQRSSSDDEMMRLLIDFVSYKTVSSDHRCKTQCNEIATTIKKCFIQHGAAETALLAAETAMNPIVFARFKSSKNTRGNAKTVMFYGHYDVVDAEPQPSKWVTDPFDATAINGYLYGRGTTDNKGPIAAAMFAVFELHKAGELNCDVVFVIEGEEESGSRGFVETIRANKDLVSQVDYVLVANSYWLDDNIPCLTYSMRGVIHATISIRSDLPDRHSGVEGKASEHEALKDLTVLLGSLVGPEATDIKIPNFYNGALRPDAAEQNRFKAITEALLPGHPEITDARGHTISLIQRWSMPNLTVHSIRVPESKDRVTIPSSAEAAVSIRIVPGQRADQIVKELDTFVHKQFEQMGSSNKLQVVINSKADAWLGDPTNALFQTLEQAVSQAWTERSSASKEEGEPSSPVTRAGNIQTKPIYIREGGSIPAISFLEKEFNAPAAMFPCGQASDHAHLDNERIRIENLYAAKQVFNIVFSEL
ncbi:MAG: hypothetical protein Q9160_003751 [Pyrenula sp. 1 TL-2023]